MPDAAAATTPAAPDAPDATDATDAPPGTADWRHSAVVYQIYPRSFADADGDGVGDLPGIAARLPALADLGVDAIWLSPFYPSPQADAGYDVSDYRGVDPLFGSVDDFDELLRRAHRLDLKVVIDLVPNHSSDAHEWFRAALAAAPGSAERDRYLFRDGRGPSGDEPPNNWTSVFHGPAWTRTTDPDGTPGQWYLHMFDSRQPDWNWDNPEVAEEFRSVLRFWLDRGVDGFRVDVANALVKVPGLPDLAAGQKGSAFSDLPDSELELHPPDLPMWDRDGVHEVYRSWRSVLDEYTPPRMLVAEAWVRPLSRLVRYVRPDEMDQAFNFEFLHVLWNAPELRRIIDRSLATNASVGAPTTWVLSNHDVIRHATRLALPVGPTRPNGIRAADVQPDAALGLRRARAATLLMLALPGSAYLYQGEELGLPEHTDLDDDLRQDPTWARSLFTEAGRDGCRVPLPWAADAPGLGFSPTGATWLPQPAAYRALARDRQEGVPGSTLEMYRAALRLRREHGLGAGTLDWRAADPGVLDLRNGGVRVVVNLSGAPIDRPAGEVLISSDDAGEQVPVDGAVWLRA